MPNGPILVNGQPLEFRDGSASIRMVKASYGIIRVLHLRHISALKQYYPSMVYRSITVPGARYRQGTPRLSEGGSSSR